MIYFAFFYKFSLKFLRNQKLPLKFTKSLVFLNICYLMNTTNSFFFLFSLRFHERHYLLILLKKHLIGMLSDSLFELTKEDLIERLKLIEEVGIASNFEPVLVSF